MIECLPFSLINAGMSGATNVWHFDNTYNEFTYHDNTYNDFTYNDHMSLNTVDIPYNDITFNWFYL